MTIRYTDEVLESLRQVGDPVPDSIMAALAEDDLLPEVNDILSELMRNYHPIPEELPDSIEFWLRDTAHVPEWADMARLHRASDFFVEHGMAISLILSSSALVTCFAAQKGVKSLTYSYRLGHNTYRRIAETCQFVLLVLAPGGLDEGGEGIPAIQKVRLLHSAIRYMILQKGDWNRAELGMPICQEDLLGTLQTFTGIVIRDLRKLGKRISQQEIDDYLYFWRVVGEMMGIVPDMIPCTLADVEACANAIRKRHWGPSEEGVQLAKSLLDMQTKLIPGTLFDGLAPAMIRAFVGDQVADWLEIPHSRWEAVIRHKDKFGKFMDILDRKSGRIADFADRKAFDLLSRQSIAMNGYQRAAFEIPESLRTAWKTE